jgi:hypothetical protein
MATAGPRFIGGVRPRQRSSPGQADAKNSIVAAHGESCRVADYAGR